MMKIEAKYVSRIWSIILLLLLSTTSYAYDAKINGIYYNLDYDAKTAEVTNNGYKTYYYSGETSINIPSQFVFNGTSYVVTAIGEKAFWACDNIQSITLPNTIKEIKSYAISSCTGIKELVIPNTVEAIGDNAISGCSGLSEIAIPISVTTIGDNAFADCSNISRVDIPTSISQISKSLFLRCSKLKDVCLPSSIISIGAYAFKESGLESITIPHSITIIGGYAFQGCSKLTSVTVGWDTPLIIDYNIFSNRTNATLYVPQGSKVAYQSANYWKDFKEILEIPSSSSIMSFADDKVKALCVANWDTNGDGELSEEEASAVADIGTVFSNTTITSFEELNYFTGIQAIQSSAFKGCNKLEKISFPASITSIGDEAFSGCVKLTGSLIIPQTVTNIGMSAFYQCRGLNGTLTLPNSITSIGDAAFYGCSGLTGSLVIPNSVTYIGEGSFIYCKGFSGSLTIPSSVVTIRNDAFRECSGFSGSLTIPNSVESIGRYAFYQCTGLTGTITLSNSIKTIEEYAFFGLYNVNKVASQIENPFTIRTTVFSGISPDAVLQVPNGTKSKYQEKEGWRYNFKEIIEEKTNFTLTIKSTGNGSAEYNETLIRDKSSSFTINDGSSAIVKFTPDSGYRIKNVKENDTDVTAEITNQTYVLNSISGNTTIEVVFEAILKDGDTFTAKTTEGVDMTFKVISAVDKTCQVGDRSSSAINTNTNGTIMIPSKANGFTVTSIGDRAFYSCGSLTSITIPNSVTSVGVACFLSSGITAIVIPNSVTNIGSHAFAHCESLTSITLSNSLTEISPSLFYYCGALTSITIPNGVTTIGSEAFNRCGLTSITIPNSVTTIGESSFRSCHGLTSVIIPNSVTSIGNSAFSGCYSLKSFIIPNNITSIGNSAFYGCSSLPSLTIPNSLTEIGTYAFCGCSNLSSIKVESGNTKYDSRNNCNALIETEKNKLITGCKATVIPNDVTSIGECAFYNCDQITSILIPSSVKMIGSQAFQGCWRLTSIIIPDGVTIVDKQLFQYCSGLTTITIPNSVTSISNSAFAGCSALTSVTVKKNTPINIGSDVFSNRTNATLYVPQGSKAAYQSAAYWKEFKEIVEYSTTYSLSITSSKGGSVTYSNNTITGITQSYSVDEETSHTLTFTPNSGYRLKSIVVNGTDVTANVVNNQYTISNISQNTTVSVTFEVIPPTTYTLTISSSGGGDVTYYENVIPGNVISNGTTQSYTVNKGGSANLTFMPNSGYRLKSVVVNGVNITASVVINQYTISSISQNTTVNVTYEAIPQYTLNLVASGNGDVKYKSITIRNKSQEWVNIPEGYSLSFELIPDEGYRVASVKENNKDVTSLIVDNLYTVSNIKEDKQLEVLFEVIPPTTYSLSITSSTGGSVAYAGNTISGTTKSNTVDEGTSHTLTFTPNSGYRLKSVVVNGTDVTASVVNNKYTISGINKNTTVNVTFEVIPPNTYTLTVLLSGDGTVSCNDVTVYSSYKFIVNEGTSHTLTITPNSGYRLKSVVVNSIDVTAGVVNNQYTISNVNQNTTIDVTFEVIPPNTYTLTILSSGGGTISRNGIMVYSTNKFEVDEGTSHTLTFTPNSGYRLKSVMVNGVDVTASVVNNQYTVSNISQNTTVIVTYEAIPQYTLNLVASGNGDVKYKSITIRNKSQEWVNIPEGYSLSFELIPDEGYRVASVKENNKDVTSSIVDNLYTVSNIKEDKQLEVLFEVVPPTTYSLSITSSTGGSVAYAGNAISGTTKSYSVNAGTSTTLTFTPNSGYRLKSVVVNGGDVTASVVNNQYTISNISQNTTVNVTFEAIPPTTYVLSITSSSGGKVLYYGYSINGTYSFTVNEKTSHTLTFTPNSGYRLKSVVVNGGDVTASVVNNQYTIYGISQNTTVSVMFEAIPPTTYILSITADGSGNVLYSGYSIYGTRNFTVNEKTSHTITFTPNSGYRLKSIVINGVDVTANVVNNQYTVSNISQNTTVEVTFVEELKAMTVSGVNYTVTSYDGKTVKVAAGDYGKVLTVPLSFDYDGETWVVYGIESGALANNEKLAAVIWNPFVAFTENPVNPNLLLYVKSASFAPSSINNVIVNSVAQKITLEESDSENDFYCPLAFTARSISYSHSYQMTTGIDKCQGWETIALPFDVQTISHGTKGVIVPFAAKTGNSQKAFWLYELTNNGWRAASAVKANTPYIISMPNNDLYYDNARLNGRITFSATDVTVPVTNANSVTYQGRTFTANFEHQQKSRSLFTLNVNNEWYSNTSGDEGSQFVAAQRDASPFEAYMTTTNNARTSFGIFEDTSTDIRGIEELIDAKRVNVYNLNGQKRKTAGDESIDELKRRLPAGVYIMNGQKVIVR